MPNSKEYNHDYYEKNRERYRQQHKAYYEKNKEKILKQCRERYEKNKICDGDCFNCKHDDCVNDKKPRKPYSEMSEESKQKILERNRRWQQKKRKEAKAKGLCYGCFKKPATKGVYCLECYLKNKRYDKNSRTNKRELWRYNGLCWMCGGECVEGKKLCAKHYTAMCQVLQNARASRKAVEYRENLKKKFNRKFYNKKE